MPRLRGPRVPVVQLVLLALGLWAFVIGGTVTFGTWGDVGVQQLMVFFMPAMALHAWGSFLGRGGMVAKGAAWALLLAMCVQSQVLAQAEVLATVGLLAALDLALQSRAHPRQAARPLRVTLGALLVAGAGLAGLGLLAAFATFDAAVRVGAAVVLLAALGVAIVLAPAMRAPARLLPALGIYYLFFVLVAGPAIPFGPAVAWWVLCATMLAGAVLAARHVTGAEVPWEQRRHVAEERALRDPALAGTAGEVERFLATGEGVSSLAARLERALGAPSAQALAALPQGPEGRAEREAGFQRILGLTD